jgi:hypothetical protein
MLSSQWRRNWGGAQGACAPPNFFKGLKVPFLWWKVPFLYKLISGVTGGCQGVQWRGAPDKNDHKKFDSTFLGFLEKCFNFGEKYHISGKFLCVSGKFFSYLGKIGVRPEKFFDSQNGTLTENFLATGGGGRRSGAKGSQKGPIDGGPPAFALRHWSSCRGKY